MVRDLDAASGGPSRSIPALAKSQSFIEGVRVSVLYQRRGNPVISLAGGKVQYVEVTRNNSSVGSELRRLMLPASALEVGQIVHLHGLWSPILHRSAAFSRSLSIPYIVSARGMLTDWALRHKALKKKLAWGLYQRKDLTNANSIWASSESEKQDVLKLLRGSQVEIVPNGCNPRPEVIQSCDVLPKRRDERLALALGRLHPVKGYAELIESWSRLKPPAWNLAIVGPDEGGYRSKLEALIHKHGLADQVFLHDEADDHLKWSLFDQCELFVAPSRSENFGMAIAEALQSGKPVITTTGTPWQVLHEYNCGWWIAPNPGALDRALREATSAEKEILKEMGARGHRLITEKYSWEQVAARTIELYRSIISGMNTNSCR